MSTKYIDSIRSIEDFRRIPENELDCLAAEIREFLVRSVSKTGGHLASNLGVVELTIALQRAFDTPKDKIIFDVGHQTYVNKILTGRAAEFPTLRQMNGLAGFPKTEESEFDTFKHNAFFNFVSTGLNHNNLLLCTCNSYKHFALFSLFNSWVDNVFAVDDADDYRTGRSCPRNIGDAERDGTAEHCKRLGSDIGINGKSRGNDGYVIEKPLGEKRSDRSVDKS